MIFLWPASLYLLVLIPLLLGIFIWMLRRRRRYTVRFSSLSLVRQAIPRTSLLRRYLPFALFLLALASLIIGLGRPVQVVQVPSNQATIILAIDVSLSMRSQDIYPSRLEAAKAAAFSFVQRQKPGTQIGIVAFSGDAALIQPPTSDQEALKTAIDSLTLGRRTAIGSGILTAINAISEIDKTVAPAVDDPSSEGEPTPKPKGVYAPDIIVLLTDGVSNTGTEPLVAAQEAVDRGIRTYTIGFGTDNGYLNFGPNDNPFSGGFGGGNNSPLGGGRRFRVGIDETTLKEVASMTGGKYYSATSAAELQSVFNGLPTYLTTRRETTEISVIFAAAGALLASMAVMLSMLWHPLP